MVMPMDCMCVSAEVRIQGRIDKMKGDVRAEVKNLGSIVDGLMLRIEDVHEAAETSMGRHHTSICNMIGRVEGDMLKNKIYVDTLSSGPINFGASETSDLKRRMNEKDMQIRSLQVELGSLTLLVQTQLGLKWPVHKESDGLQVMPGFAPPEGFVLMMCPASAVLAPQ